LPARLPCITRNPFAFDLAGELVRHVTAFVGLSPVFLEAEWSN